MGVGFGLGLVVSGLLFYVANLASLCESSEFLIQDDDLPSESQISSCRYRLGTEYHKKGKGASIRQTFTEDVTDSDNESDATYTRRMVT